METNSGRDNCGQNNIKNLDSLRNVINTLKQRCSGSVSIVLLQTNKGEGKENLPQDRKTQISKEPEKGSGSCNESTTLQVSPQAGLRANPQQNQECPSQRAGEGDKIIHEPSTASSIFHPISLQSENQGEPQALLVGRRRSCGREQGKLNTPLEHNMAAKSHNSASPHHGKVGCYGTKIQSGTLVPHLKSQSLPLTSDTGVSTSECQSDMLNVLKKLQIYNTIKRVNEDGLEDQDMLQSMNHSIPQNQNPNLSYNLKLRPQQQQPKRQRVVKPPSKRKVIRITLLEDIHESQKICFVLREVAKAFHCSVYMDEAIQDFSGPGGIGNCM